MKKQIKKLNISKMTISNLDSSEMSKHLGGLKSKAKSCTCPFTTKCHPTW